MDPVADKDNDDLNFDKGGIHLRLNRLIEKQTKRYENLINNGNHGEAQQLLQIIWQLKQLRLPEAGQDTSKLADLLELSPDQKLEPGKEPPQLPELEPWLKDKLDDEQMSMLFNSSSGNENGPPDPHLTPSMPDLLKFSPPTFQTAMPTLPPVQPPSAQPPISIPATVPTPFPTLVTAPTSSPQLSSLLPDPVLPTLPPPPVLDKTGFDDISSGEFEIERSERPKFVQTSGDFEDEASEYDDIEANGPLRGIMTTESAPVVTKADLAGYRDEVRKSIAWEEEEKEISSPAPRKKPKTYLREKVRIKSAKNEDDEDEQDEEDFDESDYRPKSSVSSKTKILVAGSAAAVVVLGIVAFVAFNIMSTPSFESLEKKGRENATSPAEMEIVYLQAVKAKPNDARGWSGLAYWQGRLGKSMNALESEAKAIKLAPRDARNWYELAILLKANSNFKQSLRAANEAVALEPMNSQYIGLQEQVQEFNP